MEPITAAILSSAASAGGGLLGGFMNHRFQEKLNNQAIQFTKESNMQARQWALDDWEKNNAYNHPKQQMQRFQEAGLNPHLIYGNANNSPSTMVRSTDVRTPNLGSQGFVAAANTVGNAAQEAMNNFFAVQKLNNETRMTDAQILGLKATTDKTILANKVTEKAFEDLIMQPFYSNLEKGSRMQLMDAQRMGTYATTKKTEAEISKVYEDILKIKDERERVQALTNLARQEGLLKQADIDTLERMSASPKGVQMVFDILKMVLGLVKPR